MNDEKTFKASNGYEIRSNFGYFDEHEDCYEVINNNKFILHRLRQDSFQALREYFRHERDQQLGRVRWPDDPDYVIYRDESEDDEDGRCVLIIDERSALSWRVWENGQSCVPLTYTHRCAADWYFKEGPGKEPERPWEEAESGEVWRLTLGGEEQNAVAEKDTSGDTWFITSDTYISAADPTITAGRKLLNADGSVTDDED